MIGPVVLTHRRIFILPNRRGFGLALLLLVQWLVSINYDSNLGFILTFLVGSVALLASLHGFRNLAGLAIGARQPTPVFAGEQAAFEIQVANPTPLGRFSVWAKLKGGQPVRLDVAADQAGSVVLGLKAERRGWLIPGTVTVFTEFPLGLFYAWSPLNFKQRVLVYPKPAADSMSFPVSAGYGRQTQDRHSADEFAGFQSYQAGDPLRHIHWKGVAKGLDPQVKRYVGEQADEILLVWEETPGSDQEMRLCRLCRWVLDADGANLRFALTLPGTRIGLGSGPEHTRRCLEALALFGL